MAEPKRRDLSRCQVVIDGVGSSDELRFVESPEFRAIEQEICDRPPQAGSVAHTELENF